MPPRLRPSTVSSAVTCPSCRPQCIAQPARTSREFSQTTPQQVTARRRKFYEWLNGPGAALRDPLPSSTNYLGAYDRYGNLVRAGPGYRRAPRPKPGAADVPAAEAAPGEGEAAEKSETPSGQESVDGLEMAARRSEEAKKKADDASGDQLPPETLEDLRPFPLNRYFRSQPVLSEELREAIYDYVQVEGYSIPTASVHFGVSNERVGAVVRLKQVEKEWVAQGKTLALPYARAVLQMLPTTPYIDASLPENRDRRPITHEPINDLIVHPATRQQLFVPAAESRRFTRVDAAKAFDNDLLPADDRIPHPELVALEKDKEAGLSNSERVKRAVARQEEAEAKKQAEAEKRRAEIKLRTVPQRRWDFVFQDVSVEHAGKDGRGAKGVGWRYGFPHEDRKKGQVKIPTRVEA